MADENMENTSPKDQENPEGHISQEELDNLVESQMQEDRGETGEGSGSSEEDERAIEEQMQAAFDSEADSADADTGPGTGNDQSNSIDGDSVKMPNVVKQVEFPQFKSDNKKVESQNIGLLLDVNLPVSIELGRTTMAIEDILNLGPGSVVELNKLAGEPVDLLVNNKMIAKGEVVVVDENFGIRVTHLIATQDRY